MAAWHSFGIQILVRHSLGLLSWESYLVFMNLRFLMCENKSHGKKWSSKRKTIKRTSYGSHPVFFLACYPSPCLQHDYSSFEGHLLTALGLCGSDEPTCIERVGTPPRSDPSAYHRSVMTPLLTETLSWDSCRNHWKQIFSPLNLKLIMWA